MGKFKEKTEQASKQDSIISHASEINNALIDNSF